MRKIFTFILLISLFGQTFKQGFYYLSYVIEKNEYVKRCENKWRPKMNCNGKCLLMKKIEEQAKREQGQPPELKLAKVEVFSSRSSLSFSFDVSLATDHSHFTSHNTGSPVDRSASVFHPPSVV